MDYSNATKESSIYWNKEAVNPPNQIMYRYNTMMNYLEGLEELQRRSTNMLYDSNQSHWNKIQSIISESNRSQLNGIQGITKLVSEFQRKIDDEQEEHNRIFQKMDDLQGAIRDQFKDQEEEFLLPLLKNVKKIKKSVKGLKKHVKSTYEELEDIDDVQDEQLELLEETRAELGQIAVIQNGQLELLEETRTELGQIATVQGEQLRFTNAQFEEIVRLQGELMLLLEIVNSSIVQLLSSLPAGNKVSSINIRGNEISLDSFISYDAGTNTATFRQIDGSLVIVDSREIVAITFPSSSN